MTSAWSILTDLCKHNTDDALDAYQRPGKPELFLFISMTIITSSAAKVKHPKIKVAQNSFPGGCLFLREDCFDWSPNYEMTFK